MQIKWGKDKPEGAAQAPRPAPPARGGTSKPAPVAPQRATTEPHAATSRKSLGHVLLQEGTLSAGQIKEALVKQKAEGGFLGQILIDLGYINENSLTSFLAKHCKIPHLSLLGYLIDTSLLELVPKSVCVEYRVLPMDKLGRNLTLAMVNPLNPSAMAKVKELCPDLRIKPILCAYSHYKSVIEKLPDEPGGEVGGTKTMTAADFGLSSPKAASVEATAKKKESESVPEAPEPEPAPPEPEPQPVEIATVEPEPEPAPPEPEPQPVEIATVEPEPAQAQEPVAAVPEAAVEEAPPAAEVSDEGAVDGDMLLEAFMGSESDAEPAPPGEGDSSSMMQEMLDVMRDSMRDTYELLARRMELFRGLTSEEVAKVFASGMTAEYEAGQSIFEKGDESDDLYVILGGNVNIKDGDRLVAELEAGELLGEMAWISDEPRSATAVATEPTSLITLNDDVFENLISSEASVQLLMNIILMLTERLRVMNESRQ